ncbi:MULTISPECIES: chemotaxis protein CheW [Shewanella]|jgi:purine-binding chemotaxis protein CheW|uniref:Chemotaxis protein CheW n=2 Tax=Shewanella TaxID=22 RepID=A0AAJ1BI36_9GAMM|nr:MULTISPECIES: chemotaxis protein CheW [Shewanella]AZQ12499.1 Chemotaxis protein CheW [Shewanella khirikhana]MCH4295170.1 chemotaxis protein CheW [Shewanella zhuhaiensis]
MADISIEQAEHGNQQFLSFIMANEEYGVDILSVQEIRGWEATTVLPNAPDYVKGVINLRGTIVPIIDLRQKFGIKTLEYGATTVVIVVKVTMEDSQKIIGIVVDAVSDVFSIEEEEIRRAPDFGHETDLRFIKGLANVQDKMVILLEINKLLGSAVLPDPDTLSRIIGNIEQQPQAVNA